MQCELQPSLLPVQVLVPLPLHGPEQMQVQVQVLVQVPEPLLVPVAVRLVVPLLLPEKVLLLALVPVSVPDPLVHQPDPLTRSVPNPLLDQTEMLPLSGLEPVPVSEQVPVLDPLWLPMLEVVPMCETAALVSGLL
jgi:hypothetical protein